MASHSLREVKFAYVLVISIASLLSTYSVAEIYKWTDENGKVHFSDQKPNSNGGESVKLKINTYESVSFETLDYGDNSNSQHVFMYSTEWCGYCKKAKRYFQKHGIAFTEYDIEKNRSAKAEYDRIGGRGVPVILVGDKRMNGFSEKGFEKIYNK